MNINDINFTIARQHELDEAAALFLSATAELDRKGIPQWDEIYPNKDILREDITLHQMYLGRISGSLACAFVLNTECDEQYANGNWSTPDARYCVVHRLCVNPEFQNMGIGRLTMEYIESLALSKGFSEIRLDTFSRNPFSVRLYERLGYRQVGTANWRKGEFLLMEKSIKS